MVGVQPSGSYRRPLGRDFSLHYPTTTGHLCFGCGWKPRYDLPDNLCYSSSDPGATELIPMLNPEEAQPRRKLRVDLAELEFAFENASGEIAHYLDLETGQVIAISDEIRRELDALYEAAWDDEAQDVSPTALADALQQRDLPEWYQEALQEAERVEMGHGTRYVRVPEADSHEGYRDIEAFIATVRSRRLQDRLWRAISGRGAFRYFKDVLLDYPSERERWFQFKHARLRERILDWLASEGIEPMEV
jgi:hypothetical protein